MATIFSVLIPVTNELLMAVTAFALIHCVMAAVNFICILFPPLPAAPVAAKLPQFRQLPCLPASQLDGIVKSQKSFHYERQRQHNPKGHNI